MTHFGFAPVSPRDERCPLCQRRLGPFSFFPVSRFPQSSSGNMTVTTGYPWSPGPHSALIRLGDVPLSTCRGLPGLEAQRPWFESKNFGRSEGAAVGLPIKEYASFSPCIVWKGTRGRVGGLSLRPAPTFCHSLFPFLAGYPGWARSIPAASAFASRSSPSTRPRSSTTGATGRGGSTRTPRPSGRLPTPPGSPIWNKACAN